MPVAVRIRMAHMCANTELSYAPFDTSSNRKKQENRVRSLRKKDGYTGIKMADAGHLREYNLIFSLSEKNARCSQGTHIPRIAAPRSTLRSLACVMTDAPTNALEFLIMGERF